MKWTEYKEEEKDEDDGLKKKDGSSGL